MAVRERHSRDDVEILDRAACAFAACTSREIRSTIYRVLTELASACGAQAAILIERGFVLFHIPVTPPAGPEEAPVDPDEAWVGVVTARRVSDDASQVVYVHDWTGLGGKVLAHPFGYGEEGSVLALRWDAPERGEMGGAAQHISGRVTEMVRRVGAVIGSALQREDLAEERRTLLRRLSESQNLDIASATAVALAHNLNNILAAMLGHTEIALEALRNQPRGYSAVMSIRNASERAAELIESILGFGQRDIPSERISMTRLAAETIELMRPAIPERITLSYDDAIEDAADDGGAFVFGRAAELQQILLNLLRNATQAIPGEGNVTVSLSQRDGDERLKMQIGALTDRPYIVLAVADDGIGIDPELRATVFRPFYTTRPAGTGLGLSAVADLVAENAGAIRILSSGGRGATFEIWLPLSEPDTRGLDMVRGDGQPVVLVAPDLMRARFEDIIAALGYEPESYGEIEDALDAVLSVFSPPHALLLCTSNVDLDTCIIAAERFCRVSRDVPMTIAVPGRMSPTPLGRIAGRQTWLAGSDNNNAIAACMRLMADVAGHSNEGVTT